jgi:hypothetical protein
MQTDGTYELSPIKRIKGLYPGEYKVSIACYDLKPGGNRDREADWQEQTCELEDRLIVDGSSRSVEFNIVVP